MTPENFCMWLNGFAELTTEPPTPAQWRSIKEHLATLFNKVTPPAPGNNMPPQQTPPQIAPIIFDKFRHDNRQWPRDYPNGPFGYPQVVC